MNHFTLTSRLVGEVTQRHPRPFTSYDTLYRRLRGLCDAGYLRRRSMLWNREHYYLLGTKGVQFLKSQNIAVNRRATVSVSDTLQRHEYEVSRFWIKFWWDCERAGYAVKRFWRDGTLAFSRAGRGYQVIPDGAMLVEIEGKRVLVLLELDRSTHPARAKRSNAKSIQRKIQRYLDTRAQLYTATPLRASSPQRVLVLFACASEARITSLGSLLPQASKRWTKSPEFFLTAQTRWIDEENRSATGWRYRSENLLHTSIWTPDDRGPPQALMPTGITQAALPF